MDFFASYISPRTQYVSYHGYGSEGFVVESEVLQGSHIGPCIFRIFVNDLVQNIQRSNYLLFAENLEIERGLV